MKKGKQVKKNEMPDLNAEFSMDLLGQAIRSKRTAKGWRIEDLALKVNLSRKTIIKIENGDPKVTFANVIRLVDLLGLSLFILDPVNLQNLPQLTSNENQDKDDGWYE